MSTLIRSALPDEFDFVVSAFVLQQKNEFLHFLLIVATMFEPEKKIFFKILNHFRNSKNNFAKLSIVTFVNVITIRKKRKEMKT